MEIEPGESDAEADLCAGMQKRRDEVAGKGRRGCAVRQMFLTTKEARNF